MVLPRCGVLFNKLKSHSLLEILLSDYSVVRFYLSHLNYTLIWKIAQSDV